MSKVIYLFLMFLNSRYCLSRYENSLKVGLALLPRLVCDQESPIRTLHFPNFIVMNSKKESTFS